MEQADVGTSGVSLTRVGLGGYEIGPDGEEAPDVARTIRVLRASVDAGVNWLDTAENYHETSNELLIGQALAESKVSIQVATKIAPGDGAEAGASGFRPEQVHAACRASLRRLGRDVIDTYFLHWPDETGVPLDETWGAMAELAEQGLVRTIGMSNYEIDDIKRCHEARRVDVVQTGLSMIDYLDDRELVSQCGELGISVVIYEPLASGALSGKSLDEVRATWTGELADSPFFLRLLSPGNAERSFAVVDGMRPIARRLDATVAQVAIAWVLAQPGVTAAIAGSRSGSHMSENAGASQLSIESVRDELEALIRLGPAFA